MHRIRRLFSYLKTIPTIIVVELDIADAMTRHERVGYHCLYDAMAERMGGVAADDAVLRGIVRYSDSLDDRRLIEYLSTEYRQWAYGVNYEH